jgi:hypothetical protein
VGQRVVSGFSPEWLALREPTDTAARHPAVLAACARTFAGHDSLTICDLGAGTGASVRAFADLLPPRQHWTLVDYDARNLDAARAALSAWADDASRQDDALVLKRGARTITVRTRVQDFAADPACWPADTQLVTASALLDLTSETWIARFAAALAAQHLPLLAVLTFDGVITSEPAHALDSAVAAAFRAHQTGDKGFGPAAGPNATDILEDHLENAGYVITAGDSPWQIDRASAEFLRQNLDGIAAATRETGTVAGIDDWLRDRHTHARRLTIGHRDVFAEPG